MAMMPADGKAGVRSAADGRRTDGAGAAPPSILAITNSIDRRPALPDQGLAARSLETPVDIDQRW